MNAFNAPQHIERVYGPLEIARLGSDKEVFDVKLNYKPLKGKKIAVQVFSKKGSLDGPELTKTL